MKVFAQLTKVDEEQRLIYARAAQETPDRSGEIMDYASSKPLFEKWSDDQADASGGLSYGNVRAMHGQQVAGVVVEPIVYNDADKALDVVVKVVDDGDWRKVLSGAYTGLSIGGSYEKRWKDGELTRYTASPVEISLVDRPCIPTAKFFDVRKTDGSISKVEFMSEQIAGVEGEVEVAGEAADVEKLGDLLNKNNLAVSDAIEAVEAMLSKRAAPDVEKIEALVKSAGEEVYDAARAMYALDAIVSLYIHEAEEMSEGEAGEQAAQVEALKIVIQKLKEFIASEISEPTDGDDGDLMALSESIRGLAKAGARNSKEDAAAIQAMHDHSVKLGAKCDAGAAQKADDVDLAKSDVMAKVDELAKVNQSLEKRISELEAMPAAPKAILRVVGKGEGSFEAKKIQPVVNAAGEVSETATLIKAAMAEANRHF